MVSRNVDSDIFKYLVKKLCKIDQISPRKPRFETFDDMVVVSLRNHLKDGIDLECFHILNIIYRIISPLEVKYNQQLFLYPNSKRVDRVTICFTRKDYEALLKKLTLQLDLDRE